jgi:hypothetical protein
MLFLKHSTAATVKIGPFLDSSDAITPEAGLPISQADVQLLKADGVMGQKNDAGACVADGTKGMYGCPLNATDTGTLGRLQMVVQVTGALPYYQEFLVIHANAWDTLFNTGQFGADIFANECFSSDNYPAGYFLP